MNAQHKQKGFTIIEVVLVLAIAGLIFLMVFIALPALQRSQRDTQRKNDLSRAITAVNSYQSNNRGRLPADWSANSGGFITDYLTVNGDSFSDPDGTAYSFTQNTADGFKPLTFVSGKVYYTTNAVCNGETVSLGQGNNKVALQYKLEGGGTACNNN